MAKKIVLLGATGSIGTQALSLLKDNSEYELVGITANKNVDKLVEIVKEFPTIKFVGIVADSKAKALKEALPEVEVLSGKSINLTIIDEANPDVVLNSILGFDGFLPSLHALKKDKILLLANKETLVVGGNFINEVLAQGHGKLIPIDSEHVAVAKCLAEVPQDKKVKELFITASGGALRDYPTKAIGTAPIQAVLAHPTWKMGPKITVDSATMVNKAYEVIEASMLFHYPLKDIKAVINRESLIHGGVVLEDGTSIYEYSPNTMLTPIKYALSLGTEKRHELTDEDKEAVKNLKTEDIDKNRYPMFTFILSLVGKYPSRAAIVVNAVDEEAVNAYLNGEIRFGDVETILRKVSSSVTRDSDNPKELKDVLDLDEKARDAAALENEGFILDDKHPDFVFIGLDKDATYQSYSKALSLALNGAKIIGTNNDRILAKPGGFEVGNGSVVDMFEYATCQKSPRIGKPNRPILDLCLNHFHLTKDEIVLLGDNLETDIKLGYEQNIETVLVQTGVHKKEDIERLQIYPTHVVDTLMDLVDYNFD